MVDSPAIEASSTESGARIAWLFQRLLALIAFVAWLSLGSQVLVLIGARGLVPVAGWLSAEGGATFANAPTLFWWVGTSDAMLVLGIWIGAGLSVLALFGVLPRLAFVLSVPLYLSYVTASRSFLAFQWDNLLLESLALGALLPATRPAPLAHLLFRILLFKLYFESGIAKLQSHLGDWTDGSAMRFYYETAPLPTALAWYFHHLPAGWHALESRATLVLELAVPFGVFGPRWAKLSAFWLLTGFQVVNLLTANYGFFVYLALALHVFLLSERDLLRARQKLRLRRLVSRLRLLGRRLPRLSFDPRVHHAAVIAVLIVYTTVSAAQALVRFHRPAQQSELLTELAGAFGPWRIVNTYHLFGHITRERIEPELQTFDGRSWTAHPFRYKPGPVGRAPPLVAPHQPRVDFLLWFHGLSYRRIPDYVRGLFERACNDPGAVSELFVAPLPERPAAVRMVYFRHHFSSSAERAASGVWWTRAPVSTSPTLTCPVPAR